VVIVKDAGRDHRVVVLAINWQAFFFKEVNIELQIVPNPKPWLCEQGPHIVDGK
jgi:hypothetical protein